MFIILYSFPFFFSTKISLAAGDETSTTPSTSSNTTPAAASAAATTPNANDVGSSTLIEAGL